ncbi:MAG TPA: class I SAM-dependent methyltransferase [Actinobacteria bacterium]|nr:class I SAM-dependent methyltransferase [Actinomycetota bacterium]
MSHANDAPPVEGSAYRDSASIYDVIYAGVGKDYHGEVEYLSRLANNLGSNPSSWLDVACGTGQHLAGLIDIFDVEGVDGSAEMLSVARRRLPSVALHEGDMRSFSLGRQFDVVSCLFSSIGYMTTVPDLHRAVANLCKHVRTGGLLMVEAWIEPDEWRVGEVANDVIESGGMTLVRVARSDRKDRLSLLDMHHLVAGPESVEHYFELHEMGLFSRAEYHGAFSAAGLEADRDETFGAGRGLYVARVDG